MNQPEQPIERNRIYNTMPRLTVEQRLMNASGFLRASFSNNPTHAVCQHGVVAAISEMHHACAWMPLVRKP